MAINLKTIYEYVFLCQVILLNLIVYCGHKNVFESISTYSDFFLY